MLAGETLMLEWVAVAGGWWADAQVRATAVTALLLLALGWTAGQLHKRRQVAAMLAAVQDATFGRCVPRSRTGAWGFAVRLQPAPEPFREFNISYHALSIVDPIDLVRWMVGRQRRQLLIGARLQDAPTAELVWARKMPPTRALGRQPGRAPWVYQRLDFAGAEYATRGANVGALRHTLQEMVTRYEPGLRLVVVQRERQPEVQVQIMGKLDVSEVSPLLAAVRGLGKAALLR
jgi:hypothetical protein